MIHYKNVRILLSLILCVLPFGLEKRAISSELPFGPLPVVQGQPQATLESSKQVLLVFWATWCPDCKEKLKSVLPKVKTNSDFGIIAVSTEAHESKVKEYLSQEGIQFPVLSDRDRVARKALKLFSVPAWAVFRKEGLEWKLVKAESAFNQQNIERALNQKIFTH